VVGYFRPMNFENSRRKNEKLARQERRMKNWLDKKEE
jgi:hypothetical protein